MSDFFRTVLEPKYIVVCNNPECDHHLKRRIASLPYVGKDMFPKITLACRCGHDLEMVIPTEEEQAEAAKGWGALGKFLGE